MTTPATWNRGGLGLGLDTIPAAVDTVLEEFLARKARTSAHPQLPQLAFLLRDFLAGGGKRLRPVLCCCGWWAAGADDATPVLPVAASLELCHAFALVHDDIMDSSDTRRGHPTMHRILTAHAPAWAKQREAERFGTNGAILLGNLAMVWSDELYHAGELSPRRLAGARPILDAMRGEIVYGQYLDLLTSTDLDSGLDAPLTVIRYKTAKYTVERPLQLGAALAGAGRRMLGACTAYGVPLGEAFQLRDDILGVFGDPATTGKSRLDDLREGKNTVLLAVALQRADPAQARTLRTLVGRPDLAEADAARVRDVLRATGALDTVERMISQRYRQALRSLTRSPFPPALRDTLRQVANVATARTS